MLGEPVAAPIREDVRARVGQLAERGVVPTLGTVLMSDDPGDERFMDLKHAACDDVGVATRDVRLDPSAPAARVYRAVEELCADSGVHAVFVQVPLGEHVEVGRVRRRLDPRKDVDCFHPENLGRLVTGDPRFVPATPAAVRHLLAAYDVPTEGQDVVIVGRSDIIGKPLANLLVQKAPQGNATVTVCHSRTRDLGAKTRRADVVVTACGVPELVDGSMLSPGVVVVDVSANRRARDADEQRSPTSQNPSDSDDGAERASSTGQRSGSSGDDRATEVVGDVDFESARDVASAITPVPGGVGPVTLATLVRNVVLAAERQEVDGFGR